MQHFTDYTSNVKQDLHRTILTLILSKCPGAYSESNQQRDKAWEDNTLSDVDWSQEATSSQFKITWIEVRPKKPRSNQIYSRSKPRGDLLSQGPKLRKDCGLLNLAVFDTVPPVFDTRPSPQGLGNAGLFTLLAHGSGERRWEGPSSGETVRKQAHISTAFTTQGSLCAQGREGAGAGAGAPWELRRQCHARREREAHRHEFSGATLDRKEKSKTLTTAVDIRGGNFEREEGTA